MSDSLGEAITSASAELTAKPEKATPAPATERASAEKTEPRAETAPAAEDDWPERPKWVDQWKKSPREKMRALAKLEGAGDLLPDVFKEIEDRYDYSGKQQAALDQLQKRWTPYAQVLEPLEQRFNLQGINPQTGLQQMVAVSDYLRSDPDQALMWLAQNFSPRDAKALIQNFAQQFGVDLNGIVQSQDWVDPTIDRRIKPLEEQNRQLMGYIQWEQQQKQQTIQRHLAGEIQAFVTAVDESGNPKHPHYAQLEPIMTNIVASGGALLPDGSRTFELAKLYEVAQYLHPDVRAQAIKSQAAQADHQAAQEASRHTAAAQEAMKASRNVTGSKTAGSQKRAESIDEAIAAAAKSLS